MKRNYIWTMFIAYALILNFGTAMAQTTEVKAESKETPAATSEVKTDKKDVPAETKAVSKKDKAVELVKKGLEFYAKEGKDKAFAAFNDTKGGFVEGEFYLFVFDMNGLCLSHGGNAKLISKNLIDMKDPDGIFLIKEFTNVVKKDGEGWVNYKWPIPGTQKIGNKSSFVKKIDDNSYVGCGFYQE